MASRPQGIFIEDHLLQPRYSTCSIPISLGYLLGNIPSAHTFTICNVMTQGLFLDFDQNLQLFQVHYRQMVTESLNLRRWHLVTIDFGLHPLSQFRHY